MVALSKWLLRKPGTTSLLYSALNQSRYGAIQGGPSRHLKQDSFKFTAPFVLKLNGVGRTYSASSGGIMEDTQNIRLRGESLNWFVK
jgi:hypothetical protein